MTISADHDFALVSGELIAHARAGRQPVCEVLQLTLAFHHFNVVCDVSSCRGAATDGNVGVGIKKSLLHNVLQEDVE